jgi:hypothetical protein
MKLDKVTYHKFLLQHNIVMNEGCMTIFLTLHSTYFQEEKYKRSKLPVSIIRGSKLKEKTFVFTTKFRYHILVKSCNFF